MGQVNRDANAVNSPDCVALIGPTDPKPPALRFWAAGLLPPIWPNPRRWMPIPSRSTSADFFAVPERGGLIGVGEAMGFSSWTAAALASASSASGSYPSFSIRSASSLAFLSASSKSITSPVTFLAPSFVPTFFAPRTFAFLGPEPRPDFRRAAEVVTRLAGAATGFESPESDLERGEAARAASLPLPALRKGEGVRPTTGGVAVLEIGGVGRLMAGLSQEEKKSSWGSPAGVEAPSASESTMTTSLGNLIGQHQYHVCSKNSIYILSAIARRSLLEFLLVFCCRGRLVFRLRIFASECSRSAILLKELGCRLVATDLHEP